MFENDADFDFNDDLPLNSKAAPFKPPTDSVLREINKIAPKGVTTASSTKKVVKRKFPGPAGILPDRKEFDLTVLKNCNKSQNEEMPCSQMSLSVFLHGPWVRMNQDHSELVERFNIKWIKTSASLNKLHNQKAPFLGALIQSIECLEDGKKPVVNVVLKDTTGEIHGTILHNLFEEYSHNLVVGAVIVIKRFGVLTAGCNNNHYLNITLNNLVTIYTKSKEDDEEESEVKIIKVQEVSCEDLIENSAHSCGEVKTKQDSLFQDEFIIPDNFEECLLKEYKSDENKFNFKKNVMHCDHLKEINRNQVPPPNQSIFEDNIAVPDNYEDCILENQGMTKKFTFKKRKTVINSSHVSASAEGDSEIWQNVLEGVDADSFFEDF